MILANDATNLQKAMYKSSLNGVTVVYRER